MMDDTEQLDFDIDQMKNFYCKQYENDAKVRETWYIYVLKFLPLVSTKWKNLVSDNNLQNENSMFTAISISDEALVRWLIIVWIKTFNDIKEKIRIESEISRGKGKHDIKSNIKLYTILHCEIETAREDYNAAVIWNKIFWEEVKHRNAAMFENRKDQSKYSTIKTGSNELQLPGLDGDQEFLATYCIEDKNESHEEV